MKKLLLLIVILILSFTSCKNKTDKERTITGKWKLVGLKESGSNKEGGNELINNMWLELAGNNKFIASTKEVKQTGTYSINNQTHRITFKNDSDSVELKVQEYTLSWHTDTLLMAGVMGTMKFIKE